MIPYTCGLCRECMSLLPASSPCWLLGLDASCLLVATSERITEQLATGGTATACMCLSCSAPRFLLCFHFPSSSSSVVSSTIGDQGTERVKLIEALRDTGPEPGIQQQTSNPRGRNVAKCSMYSGSCLPNFFCTQLARDKNGSDTDEYHRYHICFRIFGRIRI